MAGLVRLLRCVGKAVVKNGARALANMVPFGETVFDIARDVQEEFCIGSALAGLHASPLGLVSTLPTVESAPDTVAGPGRTYNLLRLLAVGDVADVHLAGSGSDPGAEPRYLLKVSRIPGGQALLENECERLAGLVDAASATTYRKYLPTLVESFSARDSFRKRVNVFEYQPGLFTLEQVHERHPALDGKHLGWIFNRLLTVLGFCQSQRVVHGAVLPCHVLIDAANHGLQLVGWGQSVEMGRQVRLVSTRYLDWYPPEVLEKQPATPAADLFLAARCLIYLAGGDPVRDRMPESVPAPMQRFLRICLLESARMRPDDAWKLQDEWGELLGRLYGPPRFHELTMT